MLKKFLMLMLITLPCLIAAQERYIGYHAHERPEDAEHDSISWLGKDKIHEEFTLKSNNPAKCRLTVMAKGEVILEQSHQNKWQVVDTLPYIVFPTGEDSYLTPQFRITDYNQDGVEDFMFLPMTNMHGTMGYYIYLQDGNGILTPLKNHSFGDDDDSWPGATYDATTKIIRCEMPGGVFGSSWQGTYRLDGCKAVPLELHNEARNTQTQFDQYFRGVDGKWVLVRQQSYIALGMGFENYDTMEVLHYRLDQDENGTSKLYFTDGEENTVYQESMDIPGFVGELYGDDYYNYVPGFLITDFNHDGDQDLLVYTGADIHGSLEALIFLADRKTKRLVKLQNTAEGTAIWDTPEYDPKTKIIACNRMGGNAGLSFTSTYKLQGFTAQPVTKDVYDFTSLNGETGKGYSESTYKGKKGKWVLKAMVKDE